MLDEIQTKNMLVSKLKVAIELIMDKSNPAIKRVEEVGKDAAFVSTLSPESRRTLEAFLAQVILVNTHNWVDLRAPHDKAKEIGILNKAINTYNDTYAGINKIVGLYNSHREYNRAS